MTDAKHEELIDVVQPYMDMNGEDTVDADAVADMRHLLGRAGVPVTSHYSDLLRRYIHLAPRWGVLALRTVLRRVPLHRHTDPLSPALADERAKRRAVVSLVSRARRSPTVRDALLAAIDADLVIPFALQVALQEPCPC